jgi:hypothetical protein
MIVESRPHVPEMLSNVPHPADGRIGDFRNDKNGRFIGGGATMRPQRRSTPARPARPRARAKPPSGDPCTHPERRLMILIRPGLSFVFCLDCEQGQWWSEGQGPIPRPERMERN